jgi:hypothetical protein
MHWSSIYVVRSLLSVVAGCRRCCCRPRRPATYRQRHRRLVAARECRRPCFGRGRQASFEVRVRCVVEKRGVTVWRTGHSLAFVCCASSPTVTTHLCNRRAALSSVLLFAAAIASRSRRATHLLTAAWAGVQAAAFRDARRTGGRAPIDRPCNGRQAAAPNQPRDATTATSSPANAGPCKHHQQVASASVSAVRPTQPLTGGRQTRLCWLV